MDSLPLLLLLALWPMPRLLFGRRRGGRGGWGVLVARSWVRFGVTSLVLLLVIGQLDALWRVPPVFAPVQAILGVAGLGGPDRLYLVEAGALGVAVGIVGGALLTAWRASRGRPEGSLFGDASSVRPRVSDRGWGELRWGAALSVTAGVTEEAYFRLLLPLLATEAFGNPVAAFAGAALLFGAAHRYQGWRGVAATSLAGVAMAVFYLASGSLLAAMAIHAAGDLGHLVLRPAVRGWVEHRRGHAD